MRTRNKAKEQSTRSGTRPKRGGTETPEPKTPVKQPDKSSNTPNKKKPKLETPTKTRKRVHEKEEAEDENKEVLFKKKRERAESPCSNTTGSGSGDDVENNTEPDENSTENSLPPPTAAPVAPTIVTTTSNPVTTSNNNNNNNNIPVEESQTKTVIKNEVEAVSDKPAPPIQAASVPVIMSNKTPPEAPLNVSLRIPEEITDIKHMIKCTDEEVKLETPEIKKEAFKVDTKTEEVKEEEKETEKVKTELIIPRVITMDKVLPPEDFEPVNEQPQQHIISIKDHLKDPVGYYNEPPAPLLNLLQPNLKEPKQHPLNLKDQPVDVRPNDQIVNMNHTYMAPDQIKQEPVSYGFPGTPKEQSNQEAPVQNPVPNTVIKIEPRDEPMELTSQVRDFVQPPTQQPLNIPQVIPMAQFAAQPNPQYEEERRQEKMERPERLDRPERQDLGVAQGIGNTPIGQPPLPSMMQSNNLVTIGGGPQQMGHYGYIQRKLIFWFLRNVSSHLISLKMD